MIVSANGQSVSAPLAGVPAVDASGQGGLLDVALDPQFATNRLVYLAYSELVGRRQRHGGGARHAERGAHGTRQRRR